MEYTRCFLLVAGIAFAAAGAPIIAENLTLGSHNYEGGPVKLLWEARYDGPSSGNDRAMAMALSPDASTVFVTGNSPAADSTEADYLTLAYDSATGEEIWSSRYDGPASHREGVTALALSPDGSTVFVTGNSMGPGSGMDFATLAYDAATGEELWASRYDGPASEWDYAADLVVSPDGSRVFVTGCLDACTVYATVAYDAATGERVWTAYDDTEVGSATSLVVSPDGSRVFVTETAFSQDLYNLDLVTRVHDAATGAEVWNVGHDAGTDLENMAQDVALSADGSTVFVVTQVFDWNTLQSRGWEALAYDAATGRQIWAQRHTVGTANALAAGPDGSMVFVTGSTGTVALDPATGDRIWHQAGAHWGQSIAVSPDGSSLFTTGYSGYSNANYATFLYDTSTGDVRRRMLYDGPAHGVDKARAMALGPDGWRVFVSGESTGVGSDSDFATLAYAIVRPVAIDIAPGYSPNFFAPSSREPVEVAILGSEAFDVRTIDTTELRFGPGEAPLAHDLTEPPTYARHLQDLNLDGHPDLVTHFARQATGIVEGQGFATLVGRLGNGQPLEGADSLVVVTGAGTSDGIEVMPSVEREIETNNVLVCHNTGPEDLPVWQAILVDSQKEADWLVAQGDRLGACTVVCHRVDPLSGLGGDTLSLGSQKEVDWHLAHFDSLGPCDDGCGVLGCCEPFDCCWGGCCWGEDGCVWD